MRTWQEAAKFQDAPSSSFLDDDGVVPERQAHLLAGAPDVGDLVLHDHDRVIREVELHVRAPQGSEEARGQDAGRDPQGGGLCHHLRGVLGKPRLAGL